MVVVCLMVAVMNLLRTITINLSGIFSYLTPSHSQMSFSPSMLFAVVGTGQCTKVLMECAGQDSRIRGLYSEGVREREREREGINISGFIFTILSIPLGHHGEMLHLLSPWALSLVIIAYNYWHPPN